jgi:hypothetical protein
MLDRERFDLMVTNPFSGKVEIRRQQRGELEALRARPAAQLLEKAGQPGG